MTRTNWLDTHIATTEALLTELYTERDARLGGDRGQAAELGLFPAPLREQGEGRPGAARGAPQEGAGGLAAEAGAQAGGRCKEAELHAHGVTIYGFAYPIDP